MASMAGGAMPPPPPGLPPYDPSGQHRPVHQPNHNGRSEHRPPAHGTSTHKSDKHRQQGHDKHRPHHDKSHPPSKSKGPPAAAPAPQPLSTALDARLRRDTPFLATIRFKNDLPEVPGDPKLLVVQQPPEKLAAFSLTTIEKEPKHDLILPPDLGITLSILDMERYAVPATKPTLHPDDLKLLGPDADTLLGSGPLAGVSKAILGIQNSPQEKRRGTALRSAAEVSWLMRTTYLSAEAEATKKGREQTEYDARREKMQRNPASVEPEAGDEEAQRQAQLRIIEATFAAARAPPVHRTKPTMRAVEVMEVLPDTDWWGHKFMSAHFDKDPSDEVDELVALSNPDLARQVVGMGVLKGFKLEEEQSQASARGGKDNASNGRFMALLLPRDIPAAAATLQEQGASGLPSDQLEGEYNWAREYSYNLISKKNQKEDRESGKSGLQQSYLIRFQGGKALYCEVNSKLELRSKREAGARSRGANQFQRPSKVVLGKRAMTAKEVEDVKRQCLALSSVAVDDGDEGRGGAGDAGDDDQWGS